MVMNIILKLLLIAFILVNIIDLSGFIQEMEKILSKWLKGKARIPKPFSCSYCMTHWIGLGYLLVSGNFNLLTYSILLMICFFTENIGDFERWMKDVFVKLQNLLYKMIGE